MAYGISPFLTTLSDLQVVHILKTFLNAIFSYSGAAASKISTDKARCVIPLR